MLYLFCFEVGALLGAILVAEALNPTPLTPLEQAQRRLARTRDEIQARATRLLNRPK